MPSRYSPAPIEVRDLAAAIIEKHCDDLHTQGVTVDIIMCHGPRNEQGELTGVALKEHGWQVNGAAKIVDLKSRTMGRGDAEVLLDADTWDGLSDEQKEAVLHHELHHFILARDVEGGVILDPCGRPKLKMRLHDYQLGGFTFVAGIHKNASSEVSQLKITFDAFNNQLFPFAVPMIGSGAPKK